MDAFFFIRMTRSLVYIPGFFKKKITKIIAVVTSAKFALVEFHSDFKSIQSYVLWIYRAFFLKKKTLLFNIWYIHGSNFKQNNYGNSSFKI